MEFNSLNMDMTTLESFAFFSIYLFCLEHNSTLIYKISKEVNFHSQEANTDEDLKICLRDFFKAYPHCTCSQDFTLYLLIDKNKYIFDFSQLSRFYIQDVLLGSEMSDEQVDYIKAIKTSSVYTNPDLLIVLNTGQLIPLELKSTKKDKIPGSSVQQVDPTGFVLFVKKTPRNEIEITTGIYANSITGRVQFPDRSPRPEVSFSSLNYWNQKNRSYSAGSLTLSYQTEELETKSRNFIDWQQSLTEEWLDYVKSDRSPRKWFDINLRMFTYELVQYYETLSEDEKKIFIQTNFNLRSN